MAKTPPAALDTQRESAFIAVHSVGVSTRGRAPDRSFLLRGFYEPSMQEPPLTLSLAADERLADR